MKYYDLGTSKQSVHIGMIAKCNYNQNYGLLLGFRKAPHVPYQKTIIEHKIFYFEKDLGLVYKQNTLVSYLSCDYDNFSPKAEYVLPLTDLIVHHDRRSKLREDRALHDDETWRLINEGKPFINYSDDRDCIVCYPIIDGDICYLYEGLWGIGLCWDVEAYIYKMFNDIRETHYDGWPSLEQTIVKINELKACVESINSNEIINTYTITRAETFFTRPGKDFDYVVIAKHYNLQTDDKYLQFLLPSKLEVIEQLEVTSFHGYSQGDYPLIEETERARDKAKAIYSKDNHLAYLIRDYFLNAREKELTVNALNKEIYYKFDIENAEKVVSEFQGRIDDKHFMRLLDEYNQL